MKVDLAPRAPETRSALRVLGFWVTLLTSGMLWLAAIFWMLLHAMTGPR
jgi:hypothetical protein